MSNSLGIPHTSQLSGLLFNARSVCNKWVSIADEICMLSILPKIIAITETWLQSGVHFNFTSFEHYAVLRADRPHAGGGVALLLHPSLRYVEVPIGILDTDISVIFCDIIPSNNNVHHLRCILIYRPPNYSARMSSNLCKMIQTLVDTQHDILLFGDLNYPDIDWPSLSVRNNDAKSTCFLDLCLNLGLRQLVNFPTRIDNILDVVLVRSFNCLDRITCITSVPPFSTSDHFGILFNVLIY